MLSWEAGINAQFKSRIITSDWPLSDHGKSDGCTRGAIESSSLTGSAHVSVEPTASLLLMVRAGGASMMARSQTFAIVDYLILQVRPAGLFTFRVGDGCVATYEIRRPAGPA